MDSHPTLALICPPDHATVKLLPTDLKVNFIIGNNLADLIEKKVNEAVGLIIIPPADPKLIEGLWPLVEAKLKWVHCFYTGVDTLAHFTKTYLIPKELPLTNGRGAFSSSLSEYICTSMLYFNKQVTRLQKNREAKMWDKFPMNVLAGKTVGFVGFGDIAKTTARVLKTGFGMKILALRRDPKKASEEAKLCDEVYGLEQKDIVFQKSDFVVCTLPGTPETTNFCGKKEFELMKPTAVFISCGRGVTVDEDALVEVCKAERIVGAALDVFKVEPLPPSSKLWDCKNILITSHNADFTDDYIQLGWNIWKNNFEAFVDGKPFPTLVDKLAGY